MNNTKIDQLDNQDLEELELHDYTNMNNEEEILDESCPYTYRQYLEILKIEFSDFMRIADSGRTIRHASLKARKISIKLRELLKMYRVVSINNDKKINQIINTAKQKIRDEVDVLN